MYLIKHVPSCLTCCVVIISVCLSTNYAMASDEYEEHPSITTISGKTYENCRVREITPYEVTFHHAKGIVKIPFSDLPRRYQRQYGYDPEKESEYLRKIEEERVKEQQQQLLQEWYASIKRFGKERKDVTALGVGQVGAIVGNIDIVQVIDEENFLAKIPLYNTFLRIEHEMVWFAGVKTENIVDSMKIPIHGIYEVSGTKTYETALGSSNTVFVLKPAVPPVSISSDKSD